MFVRQAIQEEKRIKECVKEKDPVLHGDADERTKRAKRKKNLDRDKEHVVRMGKGSEFFNVYLVYMAYIHTRMIVLRTKRKCQ